MAYELKVPIGKGLVAYVRAEFHAGVGFQEAIIWQQGQVILAVKSRQSGAFLALLPWSAQARVGLSGAA